MAEPENNKSDRPSKPVGIIAKMVDLIFKIIGILVLSAIFAIIIEWIGITYYYPGENYKHSEKMLMMEIGYLSGNLGENSMNSGAIQIASNKVSQVVRFLFLDSRIIEKLGAAKEEKSNDSDHVRFFKGLIKKYYNYLMSAIYVLIVFFIRLSILVLSIPIFALFGLVGVSDGLMQRDLRRWSGGNESSYVYHWAKRFAYPVLIICGVVYLVTPKSIHPNYIITPFAVLFGLILLVMASKFKKYL